MKPIRKPKYGKWLLIALLAFSIGMFSLLFVPAPVEGVFPLNPSNPETE